MKQTSFTRRNVHAFLWNGIEDLDALVGWVEGFGDDFEKWFSLGGQESDPEGSLYIRIPGATIYELSPNEYIVRVVDDHYAPYTEEDFHQHFIKLPSI